MNPSQVRFFNNKIFYKIINAKIDLAYILDIFL